MVMTVSTMNDVGNDGKDRKDGKDCNNYQKCFDGKDRSGDAWGELYLKELSHQMLRGLF